MRKSAQVLIILFAIILATSTCYSAPIISKPTPIKIIWEYKVVSVNSNEDRVSKYTYSVDPAVLIQTTVEPKEDMLNQLGAEGWDLVSCYLEMETAYPNFAANQELVTGLQPNVRPGKLVLIFKRIKTN